MNRVEHDERLYSPAALVGTVWDLWDQGLPPGARTGWPSLDRHYTVAPGQVTIITGWPGAGKSEWLDALLVNLMHQGWRHAIYSPENQPYELHVVKWLEKLTGKPFGPGPTERMTKDEAAELMVSLLGSRLAFLKVPEDGALSAGKVIEAASDWLEERKEHPRSLVIDPWNELEHWRPRNISETEHISMTLQQARTWARHTGVHLFIVAHPQKMPRNKESGRLPIPTLDMISGSQHWWNKADAGITVYREPGSDSQDVEIHVQKVRFKHIGRPGLVTLKYDRVSGRYFEPREILREVKY